MESEVFMAIKDTILRAILTPGSGHIITGGAGLVIGSGVGAFFSSLKAQREKNQLLRKLEYLPKDTADILNKNLGMILENTLKQLNDLDQNCKLKLALGDLIAPEITACCYLQPDSEKKEAWFVFKLNAEVGIQNNLASSSVNIEKTIDEYFKTYLKNRDNINTDNRAAAVAVVRLFRNISILLIQLMKAIAHLPGYENEQRLLGFKGIIKDFWANVLNNNSLIHNINKNIFQQIFSSNESQRKNLALHIESHYLSLINQLIIEQRDISIQQLSQYAFNQLQQLDNYFFEITARLFDQDACQEMTEITTYKLSRGMLRAETHESYKTLGYKPFYEFGIGQLLKPFAVISENLNQISNKEDSLSFVRYQTLFNDKETFEKASNWYQKRVFISIDTEEQKLINEDIRHISKLLFICQALEKDFCQSAGQYGYQGLAERGEYEAKRLMIKLFYDEAMSRIKSFFIKHKSVQNLLKNMNDSEWLTKNNILTKSGDKNYLQDTKLQQDEQALIPLKQIISNTMLQERINKLQWQRNQLDYAQAAFLEIEYLKDDKKYSQLNKSVHYDNKESKIYLFNVCQLLQEYNLVKNIQKNSEECKSLLEALNVTDKQLKIIHDLKEKISKESIILAGTYSKDHLTSLQLKAYDISYKDETNPIDSQLYHLLNNRIAKILVWKPVKTDSLFDVNSYVKTSVSLQLNFPENFDLYRLIEFYNNLEQEYKELYGICKKHQTPSALQQYLEEVRKLLDVIRGLIEHVTQEEEYQKRLKANNKQLKYENHNQKQELTLLNQKVSELVHQLKNTQETLSELSESNKKNLRIVQEAEKNNTEMYILLLGDLQENIKDIESLRESLSNKINHISELVSKGSEAAKGLKNLEREVESRTKNILERFQHYEKIFIKANEKTRETFLDLKKQFEQEQNIIGQLKNQLKKVLSELEVHRQKLAHFKPKQGTMLLVKDFDNLFSALEDRHAPKLNFFKSYRPVKTESLLNFIQILLSNQSALMENFREYKSPEGFNRQITRFLDKSRLVNAYHGFRNTSQSKQVFKQILESFTKGTLENDLRQGNIINYHGASIQLNQYNQLSYQNHKLECQVQPLVN